MAAPAKKQFEYAEAAWAHGLSIAPTHPVVLAMSGIDQSGSADSARIVPAGRTWIGRVNLASDRLVSGMKQAFPVIELLATGIGFAVMPGVTEVSIIWLIRAVV